ncbi:MAG: DUF4956 domain-containing protein [Pseudomonadota bacterium]
MDNYEFLKSLLTTIPQDSRNVTLIGFVIVLVISVIMAYLIAHLYSRFFDAETTGSRIHRSFPLMGPAVTTIFLTVQYSLPLSLGLLGALSIVRFRTPIKEPEEIGFILLVIACSISIATFNIAFAVILYAVTFAALGVLKNTGIMSSRVHSGHVLTLSRASEESDASLDDIESIQAQLVQQQVHCSVATLQHGGGGTFATLNIKNRDIETVKLVNGLQQQYPQWNFEVYRG